MQYPVTVLPAGRHKDGSRYLVYDSTGSFYTALTGNSGAKLLIGEERAPKELTDTVLDEIRMFVDDTKPQQVTIANEVLTSFGAKPLYTAPPEEARLTPEQRKELLLGFRDWSGHPTTAQTRLLAKYNLMFVPRSTHQPHPRIARADGSAYFCVSGTPSSQGSAYELIRGIKRNLLTPDYLSKITPLELRVA